MSKANFALGALIGAAAGVVAGILTAPKAGKETRADLKKKADELKVEATKKAQLAKQKTNEVVVDVTEKATEYKERGSHAVTGAVEGAKKGFNAKS